MWRRPYCSTVTPREQRAAASKPATAPGPTPKQRHVRPKPQAGPHDHLPTSPIPGLSYDLCTQEGQSVRRLLRVKHHRLRYPWPPILHAPRARGGWAPPPPAMTRDAQGRERAQPYPEVRCFPRTEGHVARGSSQSTQATLTLHPPALTCFHPSGEASGMAHSSPCACCTGALGVAGACAGWGRVCAAGTWGTW